MSDLHRLRTLDSLQAKGVYVNDYPGLIMDGKDISYFYFHFQREFLFPNGAADQGKKGGAALMDRITKIVTAYNQEFNITGTDQELRIFYMDDQGYCIIGRVEERKDLLRFTINKKDFVSDRVFQVNLTRVYAAEGIDGLYQVRNVEVKGVYEGITKYISLYMHGWNGLFRQYPTLQERTQMFRQFKPFKVPLIGRKETLKNATFTLQLGIRAPNGDVDFKKVVVSYGTVSLDDALSA